MSVTKRNGRWQSKNRDANGRWITRTFDRKGDADTFDTDTRRRLQLGALADDVMRTATTLDAFARNGFRAHAATLAPATRAQYTWALENHLTELLDVPLDQITVPRLAGVQQHLLDRGRTPHTVRTAITMLSGILAVAVEHGELSANPVRDLRKVKLDRRDEINPLSPVEIETLIVGLEGRERAIALLGGHLGLRPVELRLVRWNDLGDGTLMVGRARTKKTAARTRTVAIPAATRAALRAWQLQSGGRGEEPIIGPMTSYNLKAVGARKLGPAAERLIGRDDVTVYTLRHSHASALHYCGWTVPAAARRLGHGPALHVTHYAHVIDALEGQQRYADLDALIAAARTAVPSVFPAVGHRAADSAL